jgi:hypothetical protein
MITDDDLYLITQVLRPAQPHSSTPDQRRVQRAALSSGSLNCPREQGARQLRDAASTLHRRSKATSHDREVAFSILYSDVDHSVPFGPFMVVQLANGGRGVYWHDPDGHFLEIITRPYGG